jgi:hypothetical protein
MTPMTTSSQRLSICGSCTAALRFVSLHFGVELGGDRIVLSALPVYREIPNPD